MDEVLKIGARTLNMDSVTPQPIIAMEISSQLPTKNQGKRRGSFSDHFLRNSVPLYLLFFFWHLRGTAAVSRGLFSLNQALFRGHKWSTLAEETGK